jgi:hypothetical protein
MILSPRPTTDCTSACLPAAVHLAGAVERVSRCQVRAFLLRQYRRDCRRTSVPFGWEVEA